MNLTNNQIKTIKSLHQAKFRQIYKKFVAEGEKLAMELLRIPTFETEIIAASSLWLEAHENLIQPYKGIVYEVSDHQMEQISGLHTPTSVLLVAKQYLFEVQDILNNRGSIFYLDGVQDPGNVGTIIRIADWFGFAGVISSEDCADFFHPKVVQASMGSIVATPLANCARDQFVAFAPHLNLIGLDMLGKPLTSLTPVQQMVFVMGSEGRGISALLKSIIREENLYTIQGSSGKTAESLNVSVAAGILAHTVFTQNR
ncbi:MAG: RNA methyltransferase [Saprospiraceae bacterium]|nr:RNA methyltransferase [Saprospiraceae bacterium]